MSDILNAGDRWQDDPSSAADTGPLHNGDVNAVWVMTHWWTGTRKWLRQRESQEEEETILKCFVKVKSISDTALAWWGEYCTRLERRGAMSGGGNIPVCNQNTGTIHTQAAKINPFRASVFYGTSQWSCKLVVLAWYFPPLLCSLVFNNPLFWHIKPRNCS